MQITTHSADETQALGKKLAESLRPGDVIAYFGDLGAGKTAFTRGIAEGLGVLEQVTSPTYTIVNEYLSGRLPLFHFDMYRLGSSDELFDIGWEDYLARGGVCAVEWSENVEDALQDAIRITIEKDSLAPATLPSKEEAALNLLAFESSAKAASAALLSDGCLLAEYTQNSGQTHSRTLMELAKNMITGCDLTPQDIDAVAVAAGPGSFTGVRIGMACAKGFAWGHQLPLYGVSTLEAMVRGAACADGGYCACMDARKGQIYNALFDWTAGTLLRRTEDRAIAISELSQELQTISGPVYLIGDGAKLVFDTLKDESLPLQLLPEHLRQQRASGVALAAMEKIAANETGDAAALTPNYLRQAQAERTRQHDKDFYLKK